MPERIKITGVEGRVAFTAAKGGTRVPYDRPISVPKTSWIQRRLEDGDIQLVKEAVQQTNVAKVTETSKKETKSESEVK
jgi:Protein of unknown function (DUF2635).